MNAPHPGARSFAGVTYEDAIGRARAMVPALRSRAAQAEKDRVMPPETLADLHASGILRTLQPRRWGGMEFDFVAYVDFCYELARGCPSTAWNFGNLQVHHWMLAMYEERAQEEVWGANPEALIASGIAFPQGRGKKVEGGYVISGKWNFSSCSNIAEWNMLAVTVRDGDRAVDYRMCLLHKSQYEVIDDWQVLGMRATGSMTVAARDVFVPEYKALGMRACAVGNAQAALESTIASVKERSTSYTGAKMRDFQAVQLRVGAAGAKIDAARLVLRNDCLDAQEIADRRQIADVRTKLRFKRNLAYAVNLCTEAVDALHAMAGANGIYEAAPLERIFRDAHSLAGHISFSFDAQASSWGLVALGGEVNIPTL